MLLNYDILGLVLSPVIFFLGAAGFMLLLSHLNLIKSD